MMKKIIIIFFLTFSISNNAFSKPPPPGSGSLVPSNIMIMLDNSGSMGWNLDGYQLSSSNPGFRYPYGIKTDSNGDVYVLQQGNTCITIRRRTCYRMHVFGSDGTFKRRMMPYKYNRRPNCSGQTNIDRRWKMYLLTTFLLFQLYITN